jgi:predicted aconitase
MKGLLGILATAAALLGAVPLAHGEEQTRETYKARVEPICEVNRKANERIMEGAQRRVNRSEFTAVGKQFIRVSESFGGLIPKLAKVPPPLGDERRVERWFEQMRLVKTRLRQTGKYYKEGEDIKAAHEAILAERSGIAANNISIVFKVRYCRFSRFERK